jgi:hypothetical protein
MMNAPKPLRYPNYPGHYGVPTSVAAADDLAPVLGRLQALAEATIRAAGSIGLTADELAARLGMERWSIQPRTTELSRKGLIIDSGLRRRNVTNKMAIVWIVPTKPGGETEGSEPCLPLI